MERTYLDYNATCPVPPTIWDAIQPLAAAAWANPSSVHAEGRAARRAVECARGQLAATLGCHESELLFTGSATESNHLAVLGSWMHYVAQGSSRNRIITSGIEHPCVRAAMDHARELGAEIVHVQVDSAGMVDPEDLGRLLDDRTALVCVMWANNESGAIQPVERVVELAHHCGARVHIDAAQALGRLPIDLGALPIDLLTVSGHKVGALKGVGALFARRGTVVRPLLGGHQERGLRGGTENTLGIASFGLAAELAAAELEHGEIERQRGLRDALWQKLHVVAPELRRIGVEGRTLPNTLLVMGPGSVRGDAVVMGLDLEGVAASSGAACTSGTTEPSHVLLAMGYSAAFAAAAVRFSLGRHTTDEHIQRAAAAFGRVWERLRGCDSDADLPDERRPWTQWAEENDRWTE